MKKETIKTLGGELIVTEMKVKHSKSGEQQDYISFSDGMNVVGVYLGKDTKKELAKFLGQKETKRGASSKSE